MYDSQKIAAIRLSLASAEQIRAWSWGEVTQPDTLNYQTFKPEKGGLFCERIFGPTKDWTCTCGKYQRARVPGFVCDKCGVEITLRSVRRERLGHIELACPIAHSWYARSTPCRIGLLLDLPPNIIERILSYEVSVIIAVDEEERTRELSAVNDALHGHRERDDGQREALLSHYEHIQSVRVGDQLEEEQLRDLQDRSTYRFFSVSSGAEALEALLAQIDLQRLSEHLRQTLKECDEEGRKKAVKRLSVVEAFRHSQIPPTRMIFHVIPVLPPELRPMLSLGGGRFATADINDLYTRVINRNNRVKKLMEINAPKIILNNEKRLLQDACDALIDNKRRKHPLLGSKNTPLKSLSDTLAGKEGRLRRNLLGKRVDYSGRSVISVGLDLELHQCGLPKKIALELYKPFIIRKLLDRNLAGSARQAKRFVERKNLVIWDILEEVMAETCVLLNRAPTLHRLSIQAFEPVLVEGGAIRLHPLVCSAFNADFDGDQMAVHLPLTPEAQREARELMLSTQNLRSPATGEPSISISQEMVLGCFYLTQERPQKKGEGRLFSDPTEALIAYEHGIVDLQARIRVRLKDKPIYNAPPPALASRPERCLRVETTVGRLIFNELLPEQLLYRNYAMKKECLKQIVAECLNAYGPEVTAKVANEIKHLGFHHATRSGISFSTLSDIAVPPERKTILEEAEARVEEIREEWRAGTITENERYQQVVATWNEATERISKRLEEILDPFGNIYTIAKSGATKAKFQQIRQLSGMRGLMASPSGHIIEIPIKGNYLIGLTVAEYMIGSHGARKGAMDRSLNTAKSGYRTRVLVEVGHQVSILMHDCGTRDGILITLEDCRQQGLPDMRNRIISRVLAEGVGELEEGTELTEKIVDQLRQADVTAVRVRSPLTCEAPHGICQRCYGHDLATGTLVRRGTAVGIIAAQSIGEPGTQLTMRTFHSGGIAGAQGDITQGLPRVNELFEAREPKQAAIIAPICGVVEIENDPQKTREQTVHVIAQPVLTDNYLLPTGSTILVQDGTRVERGQQLAESPGFGKTIARNDGLVRMFSGSHLSVISRSPRRHSYTVPAGRKLVVTAGQKINAGSPLTTGTISPHDLLVAQGSLAAQRYLVDEIQRVYRTTGVYLHDKHCEVIVRQMARYVQIEDDGDTPFIPGSIVDRFVFAEENASTVTKGGTPASAHPVILGTIKAALHTESWLTAASFQETTRILADAAIQGKKDDLSGLKQHIILGKRIPVPVKDTDLADKPPNRAKASTTL